MELQKNIDLLKLAIQKHKPIEFEYIQDNKPIGKRFGNPHAIFEDTTKGGIEAVYTHIVQTGGVSETLKEFPDWRMFFVDKIKDIKILENEPSFSIQDGYNPFSVMYSRAIYKI
ncbi:MAG: hypothetical protein A3A96_02090 [Candidatus Zambryskibacteria bacterium RIFCSPLOWO2_01_FULL_39_39]|uniref:Uncharacterized protein n=1 Tax=Candidatus Zambryskibacteria bacterium RIFCSPLOWO2_01_FULL_39_39 TaxID=1802758 RepID=A0A1G2TWB4_9BACT|nr:MAG: hypothetical protein A2644_01020 [Candidatus Zambryskibacteria bacterium RIFCSPHIGHO2_01_FULL_39_63]OHA94534.1 MAG: hypothetical protein A3B88_01475 [Candidatus Zambryskibacteria bacterium RIFCSPHIGHO2_02_FULL_39_19]OHA97871.1 MAG: hypothetical protein A3F20_01480 [Candidatus Zambryskibacteria bacterium RIFCSPHIGHO2_12_FULL_39_21]OHB01514.1 MAG: hypothetical protein A3A96_02090 [Candidatus Zambryskibacteria bacterium RIFCSPLOWO2_01_FULL_39_39]